MNKSKKARTDWAIRDTTGRRQKLLATTAILMMLVGSLAVLTPSQVSARAYDDHVAPKPKQPYILHHRVKLGQIELVLDNPSYLDQIAGYHIYVDGEYETTIKGVNSRSKCARIEPGKSVTVTKFTRDGQHSPQSIARPLKWHQNHVCLEEANWP